MPREGDAEGAGGAVADALRDLGDPALVAAQQVLRERQVSRYSIGATPTARVKRSKKVERESAASFASSATVHACVGRSCIPRIAAARRLSASPRTRPGDAFVPAVDRSASMSSISRTKSPENSSMGACPSIAMRHPPSRITQ